MKRVACLYRGAAVLRNFALSLCECKHMLAFGGVNVLDCRAATAQRVSF